MKKILNFITKSFNDEKKNTDDIIKIIDNFSYIGTDNTKGSVNTFTLLWKLIDCDENFNILKTCNKPAKLRDALRGNTIRLSSKATLNTKNYIYIKTELNKIYKWFRKIADTYKQNSIHINKEEVKRALLDKSPNISKLLTRNKDTFAIRLSRLTFLPKIQGDQGGYAIERPHYKNGDRKLIENFVKFIVEDKSEKQIITDHFKSKSNEYISFIKRKKTMFAIFALVGILTTGFLTFSSSSSNLIANIFTKLENTQNTKNLVINDYDNISNKNSLAQEICIENNAIIAKGICEKISEIKFSANKNTQIQSNTSLQIINLGRNEIVGNYIILRYKSNVEWKKAFLGNISFDNNSTSLVNLKSFNEGDILADNLKEFFLFEEFDVETNNSDILKEIKNALEKRIDN